MQITPAFAIPFVHAQLPDSELLNAQLRELFLQREAAGEAYANPHPSMQIGRALYESAFNLFSWTEGCVQQLNEFCWGVMSRAISQLNGYDAATMQRMEIFSHTWFHVTRRGGYFGAHNHPMASWSGVYCVSAGDDDADRPNSGILQFSNPHHLGGMFADPANSNIRAPYNLRGQGFKLKPGQLILFPSWLVHEVLPFHGEGERITVAFNCWFGLKDK
jgi:uncharacterized protein (TIGR02466 family)